MAEKEITLELKHPETILLLLFLCILFFFELQLTLNSPIVFGDEGFHTRMSQYMAQEKDYPVWVPFEGTKLNRNGFSRPPLWEILQGSFLYVFGFSEFTVKFLTPFIATILTGIAVYVLVKRIYNEKMGLIASIITVAIPSYVTYAVLFYVDILFTFYFSLFVLTFILAIETENRKYLLLSGIFGSLSILTKTPGVAAALIVGMVFIYQLFREKKNFIQLIKNYSALIAIGIVILSPFFLRSLVYYKDPACFLPLPFFSGDGCQIMNFTETNKFPGRTEQTGTEQSLFQIGIINYLNFAYGNIWFVIVALVGGLGLMISKSLKKSDLIILVTFLTLLIVLSRSTDRAEDTARYTLGWVPIIALVSARYFHDVYEFIRKYQKYIALVVFVFILVMSYQSYMDKLNNMKSVKKFSPSFFEACDWVKQNLPKDVLIMTVWSHHAAYNCQRNVVGNMADISVGNDVDHTLSTAKSNGITHIFIQKFSLSNEPLSEKYSVNFIQMLEKNPDHFKKVYENGSDFTTCISQGGCDGTAIYEIKY